jgi:hypothetical protein
MATKTIEQTRRTDWDVKWDNIDLGLLDEVDPGDKISADEIKTGTTGKLVLGKRVFGVSGPIKVAVRQVAAAVIQQLQPWYPAAHPPIGVDLYTYAKALVLHPHDLPAEDLTEDRTIFKAVPMTTYDIKRTGEKDDVWVIEFEQYPDRTRLLAGNATIYGYIGATVPED